MPNFSQSLSFEGKLLDFRFMLIHRPGGARYSVVVSREDQYLANFYFEKNEWGFWKLSDRYQTAPGWVHALEPLLAESILRHLARPAQ